MAPFFTGFTRALGGGGFGGRRRVPRVFTVSPLVNGLSTWNLTSDGALILDGGTSTTYTLTPQNAAPFTAPVNMWGEGSGGLGGSSTGTVTFNSGATYEVRLNAGKGTGGSGIGAYGPAGAFPGPASPGGGYAGLFLTSVSQGNSVMISGGAGAGGNFAVAPGGPAGGPSGTAGGNSPNSARGSTGGGGGTQVEGGSGGGNGGIAGSALQGGAGGSGVGPFPNAPGGGGGGGGYYGGGGGGGGDDPGAGTRSASGGGGGSGYVNPSYVTGGSTSSYSSLSDPLAPGGNTNARIVIR